MADAPLTFTPEDQQLLAKVTKLIEALIEPHDIPDGDDHAWRECRRCLAREELEYDSSVPMLVVLLAALRRLSAVEGQRCDTCKFAGPEVNGAHTGVFRRCYVLRGVGHQLVPLVNAQGEPHGCNSWQPHPAQETR